MGHRPLRREANVNRQIDANRARVEQLERRQLAGRWWVPGCTGTADPDSTGCYGIEPSLENGWEQPTGIETFAFRLHSDGSLEFRGHLDSSGASSGTVAVTLPGAGAGEVDFRPANDHFFLTVVYDGSTPQAAMVYIDSTTGEVTITFPV